MWNKVAHVNRVMHGLLLLCILLVIGAWIVFGEYALDRTLLLALLIGVGLTGLIAQIELDAQDGEIDDKDGEIDSLKLRIADQASEIVSLYREEKPASQKPATPIFPSMIDENKDGDDGANLEFAQPRNIATVDLELAEVVGEGVEFHADEFGNNIASEGGNVISIVSPHDR